MTEVTIPNALAKFTDGQTRLDVSADTLGAALQKLTEQHQLGDVVLGPNGDLQPYIRVVVDDTVVSGKSRSELDRISLNGSQVELKTAFAGG